MARRRVRRASTCSTHRKHSTTGRHKRRKSSKSHGKTVHIHIH
ncbi:MAG: hypothetical protein ACRCX8_19510 [Sarcina sp.]